MEDQLNEMRNKEERNKNKVPLTYDNIISFLQKRTERVIEGFDKGYELALLIKNIETELTMMKGQIKETVLIEIENGYTYDGHKFEPTQSGRYVYDHSDDWKKLSSKRKELEKMMQMSYKTGKSIIDEDTGEVYDSAIYKPNKPSYKISKTK
jgi:hypothetical protein